MNHTTPSIFMLALIALVAWRLYARMRRLVGRQKFSPLRTRLTMVFFPLLTLGLMLGARHQPLALAALLAGLAVGAALGRYGLGLTQFETTPEGWFYTPNAHLGIALSLLLAARVMYRLLMPFLFVTSAAAAAPQHFIRSPLTLLIFGTLAAYYVVYAYGLLAWRRQPAPAAPAALSAP
jgi:Kef-type K+ transport system membrane component KefB